MPTIIIDGQPVQCDEDKSVLQAALDAGFNIPHYCFHPELKVVASCRLCLMEMKMPHPKTKEMVWSPKLVPSCQTPAREGLEVRFNSEPVKNNVERVMEYYLLNHPLDCPVCDQAGECWLQDYSMQFGAAVSRNVESKVKQPKKDVGPRTLLYMDRCVLCSRCVRFTREISGTGELGLVNRGNHSEIDVFPGTPLDNKLQGNVVDICPVGALLDKEFLFKQRVWYLQSNTSICRGCSSGCAIHADHNKNRVYRLRPRYNPGVNEWWMCDEGRFGWKYMYEKGRVGPPAVRIPGEEASPDWQALPKLMNRLLEKTVADHGAASVAVQLSPEMACEEAWLLADTIRRIAPEAEFCLGDVQVQGEDELFPVGCRPGQERFKIHAEKNPNRRGIETLLEAMRVKTLHREQMWERAAQGQYKAFWVVGGYPQADWAGTALLDAVKRVELLIVQDLFENELTRAAQVLLPAGVWLERSGTFMNAAGKLQPFERVVNPPEGLMHDGQYLLAIAGHAGLYNPKRVRAMMAETMPVFGEVWQPPLKPRHQH